MSDPPDARDPHATQWQRIEDAILRGAGMLTTSMREALAAGRDIPRPLAVYVEKVTRHAYRVTDDDVKALLEAGYSQDQLFEATLSIALGAAHTRLRAGLDALQAASQDGAPGATPATEIETAADEAGSAMKDEEA